VFLDILQGEELENAQRALADVAELERRRSRIQSNLRSIRRNPDDQRSRGRLWADWTQQERDAEIERMLAELDDINAKLESPEGGKWATAACRSAGIPWAGSSTRHH